jgi:hypothetical protein
MPIKRKHKVGDARAEIIDNDALTSAMTKVEQADWTPHEAAAVKSFANRYVMSDPDNHLTARESVAAAIALLDHRFCDFPDPPDSPLGIEAYHINGALPRKTRPTISLPGQSAGSPLLMAAQQAFSIWSAAAPALVANFTTQGSGDISVSVGDLPPGKAGSTSGGSSITLTPKTVKGPNLVAVLAHELGHALGLGHATTKGSIMYPFDAGVLRLTDDDTSAIRARYGWSNQRLVQGRATDCGPALCAAGNDLAMAWKGADGDSTIWFSSSSDGVNWTEQQPVPLAGTTDSPALAYDSQAGVLHMAWKGVDGDSRIYWSYTWDLKNWGPVVPVEGVGTSHGPALTMTYKGFNQDRLVMAWKGAEADANLYFTRMGSKKWDSQQRIGGVGSSEGPALCTDLDGVARMVWRGVSGDEALWSSTLQDLNWQPQERVQWVVPGNGSEGTTRIDNAISSFGPAACTRRPVQSFASDPPPPPAKIFVAWHGGNGDSGLFFTQRARDMIEGNPVDAWSSQSDMPDRASSGKPALAMFDGQLHIAWKGFDNDRGIYVSEL